jgi:predicted XRE-type DNA-binding protein
MEPRHAMKKRGSTEPIVPGSKNVFADLGFPKKEAAELKVKAELALQIHQRIKDLGLIQTRAAERLGLSQPDVSKLMAGRYTGYSVDRLLSLLNSLDVGIDIVVRPKHRGRNHHPGTVRVLEASRA